MRPLLILLLLFNLGWLLWHLLWPAEEQARPLPPPAQGVARLQLLSERRPAVAEASPAPGTVPQEDEAGGAQAPMLHCYSLGPFRDRKTAQRALERLKSAGVEAGLRSLEEQSFVGYWVYLPPFASRDEARKVARELARKGIKDFYIVSDREQRNAISLGLFRDQFHANRRLARLRAMGYHPRKQVRKRDRTVWWIDYSLQGEAEAAADVVKAILEGDGRLDRVGRSCPAD